MTCLQSLYKGRHPANLKHINYYNTVNNIADCSQLCCNDSKCYTYTHKSDTDECWLWPSDGSMFYRPTRKHVPPNNDPNTTTGVLWSRKIRGFWPILLLVVGLIIFFTWRHYKKKSRGQFTSPNLNYDNTSPIADLPGPQPLFPK